MSALTSRFRSWVRSEKCHPFEPKVIRGQRIYILPTRYGVLFGLLLILMLIGSLNYDNNPAYLLTFLLGSIAFNAIYQTWRNLRSVEIRLLQSPPVFCGEPLRLRFQVNTGERIEHPAIQLQCGESAAIDDLPGHAQVRIFDLYLPSRHRGWCYPGQVVVSTRFPLGLFRAWCYIEPEEPLLVYPAPAEKAALDRVQPGTSSEGPNQDAGHEDFFGLRDYRSGDSPRQIDWKSQARERGLMSKQFCSGHDRPRLLDWYQLHGDTEARLSWLTRALLEADRGADAYGLRLPGLQIGSNRGAAHRHACLKALALFTEEPAAS